MHRKVLAAALLAAPLAADDRHDKVERQNMSQAIAFERHKEEAARRQAKAEKRRGSQQANADRQASERGKQPVNRK